MLKRNREEIIDQDIEKRSYSSLSQQILAYGIIFICIYFFVEILLAFFEYYDIWSLRRMTVLFAASIVAIVGCIIGLSERKRNPNGSMIGITGNLSLLTFYVFVIIQNEYYLVFV